jgi:16S rRNA (cytidine1402-2'-O)-methyltransferase
VATLYVVATPIGNLEDVTMRALRVLREVGLIAAEDTRTTRKLLSRYGIHTPITSYNEHNSAAKVPDLLSTLQAKDVALVSEAGMPGISDPGHELVSEAARAGFPVVPVPGASALTACMAIAALRVDRALFLGFLPRRKADRRRLVESLASFPHALVAFESPHRLQASLEALLEALGDRRITLCRELTKVHEEVFRGSISQALSHFVEARGEFTLVVQGAGMAEPTQDRDASWARMELVRLKAEGVGARDAVAAVAGATGRPKRELYRLWLETRRQRAEPGSP